jgi:hypothetical protein
MEPGYRDNKIIEASIYTEAYLNKLKFTCSDGRNTEAKDNTSNPEERTAINRSAPACTPIIKPATAMEAAASRADRAMMARVASNP